ILPREKKDFYALSPAQKSLYVLHRMEPGNTGYHINLAVKLEGALDMARLEKAFRALIQRHDSLRTSFHMEGDHPIQRVQEEVGFEVKYESTGNGRWDRTANVIDDFIRPFDLSLAPLIRVGVIHNPGTQSGSSGDEHILLVDMHHIICDGTSTGILVKEFMDLYAGKALPLLPLRYRDYCQWQNSPVQKKLLAESETYWLEEFTGEIEPLELPYDFPRP
ncbi:MAG: hypothetical protein GY940_46845, partial [bacterium]|nr:hypothetical protein [bacterium]